MESQNIFYASIIGSSDRDSKDLVTLHSSTNASERTHALGSIAIRAERLMVSEDMLTRALYEDGEKVRSVELVLTLLDPKEGSYSVVIKNKKPL
jgi:hypothetical protein